MLRFYRKAPKGKFKGKPAYCVVSHKTGKVLSCYSTKRKGQKALRRYEIFSHLKKEKSNATKKKEN